MLAYEWDPDKPPPTSNGHRDVKSFDLGPHPADPHSVIHSPSASDNFHPHSNGKAPQGPNAQSEQVPGQEIWVYAGNGG